MKGLKLKRSLKNLSRKALSVEIGISEKAIYQYESSMRFPRKAVLDKLCKFFDCTIDDLL